MRNEDANGLMLLISLCANTRSRQRKTTLGADDAAERRRRTDDVPTPLVLPLEQIRFASVASWNIRYD
jgi:hypothetical protein